MSEAWRDSYDRWKLAGPDDVENVLGSPECICLFCGADAIGTDGEGRWACGRHIELETAE